MYLCVEAGLRVHRRVPHRRRVTGRPKGTWGTIHDPMSGATETVWARKVNLDPDVAGRDADKPATVPSTTIRVPGLVRGPYGCTPSKADPRRQ